MAMIKVGEINGRAIYYDDSNDKRTSPSQNTGSYRPDFNRLNNETYKAHNGQYSSYYSNR